eukprot:364686-Chlamydomonas_euryale.AAC.5
MVKSQTVKPLRSDCQKAGVADAPSPSARCTQAHLLCPFRAPVRGCPGRSGVPPAPPPRRWTESRRGTFERRPGPPASPPPAAASAAPHPTPQAAMRQPQGRTTPSPAGARPPCGH